jgi:DNA-binding transcriptional LysR family regulator
MSFVNISQAAERIRTEKNARTELRVGASPAFSSLWLAPRLPGFLEGNRDICINIMTTDEFSKFESSARPDVFISMNQALYRDYSSVRLFSEKIYPVCSPEFIRLHPDIATLQGLRESVLVELSPFRMSQIYEHLDWNAWFYLAGLQPTLAVPEARPACCANDYNVVLEMAMAHQGVALGWDHLVRPLLDQGRLARPVAEEVVLKEKAHYLFYGAGIAGDPAFLAFRDWLLASFESDSDQDIARA